MLRALILSFALFAAPALASGRTFAIGGEGFREEEIVDARALPQLGGGASILITLSEEGGRRLAALSRRMAGGAVAVDLDGTTISRPVLQEPILDGVFQISGSDWTIESAAGIARRISGKDPLPESLDD
jgi:preprotein translocase subunit SecD